MTRYCLTLSLLLAAPPASTAAEPPAADFADAVAPVLARRCLSCHGKEKAEGGLSIASAAALVEGGYVVPGEVESSYLVDLITAHDGQAEMPKDADPLTEPEAASIRRWIDAGARIPDGFEIVEAPVADLNWWSLEPIDPPQPPETGAAHPVDRFLEAKLRERGVEPNGPADATALIRRLTYDLTGLPPTFEEAEAFRQAYRRSPEAAWTAAVDRLLASSAFGEKWAQHWLDLARYAETHGYDKDRPRENAWPYRDYVIRSFNEDKPYAQFVREQIAGDVLDEGRPDGILGLGFLAAGPWDYIGHVEVGEEKFDGRIAKHLDRDEMASAAFNVFLSATVQCAQCHPHKFDPIRVQDYYRLQAVFAAVDRADRAYDGSPEQRRRRQELERRIAASTAERTSLVAAADRRVAAATTDLDREIEAFKTKFKINAEQRPQFGYHSRIESDPNAVKWVQVDLGASSDVQEVRIVPAYDEYADIGAGFGFPLRYRLDVSDDAAFSKGVRTLLNVEEDRAGPSSAAVVAPGDGRPFRFLRLTATQLAERRDDYILALGEIEALGEASGQKERPNLARGGRVDAKDGIEAPPRWGAANLVDGVYFRSDADPAVLATLHALEAERTLRRREARRPETTERLEEIDAELARLTRALEQIPPGRSVFAAATHFAPQGRFRPTEGTPRPVRVLHRGDLKAPGEAVVPGAPPLWEGAPETFVDGEQWQEGEARAALAGYLTARDNPLVWRSIANRLWGWTFGAPLVGTPNDFGRGGQRPTHPELLDFLAAELRDDPDQSLKSIVRLLVTSRAYRRHAGGHAAAAAQDADNSLLWRANRRRLTAEEFRDSLLQVAGALDRTVGGPSFRDFALEKPEHSPHYLYGEHDPSDPRSHRRSVYRFVVRSQPQPLLTTLDCADPSISVPVRTESTTALQALGTWNNPLVSYAAQQFGERVAAHAEAPEERVRFAVRRLLGREPAAVEVEVLQPYLEEHGPANLARTLFSLSAFLYLD